MTKKWIWWLFFLLIFSLFPNNYLPTITDTAIASDELVWENEYGKLVVYPSTSNHLIFQQQYCNLTWYYPDNSIDVAFRFNQSLEWGQVEYYNGGSWNTVSFNHQTFNGKHYYVHKNFNVIQDQTYYFRWKYKTLPGSSGKWDLLAKLSSETISEALASGHYILLDPWWDSNWDYKKQITLDKDQVSSTQTNFPICINLASDSDLVNHVGYDNGSDIAFVDSLESTQLDHEIEYFNNATGRLTAWVEIPSLSNAVDTVIYMYYGNPSCSNQSAPTGVWDSNYMAVWHMNGTGTVYDSTSNNIDLVNNGADYISTGKTGPSRKFIASNTDYLEHGSFLDTWESELTWECWFNRSNADDQGELISKINDLDNYVYFIITGSGTSHYLYSQQEGDGGGLEEVISTVGATVDDQWYYAAMKYKDNTKGEVWLDTNHEIASSATDIIQNNNNENFFIGSRNAAGQWFNGSIDEIRISNINRTNGWIITSYNSINNASDGGFFTLGGEQSTGVGSPTNLVATTDTSGNIDLTWTKGENSTHTRIEHNTISTWSQGSGTFVYNGTGSITSHTNPSCGILYYYLAWGYNSTQNNWSAPTNTSNISCPGNPTDRTTASYDGYLNFTWTKGNYADNTLIIRKDGSFPTSVTDGTVQFNATSPDYHNDSGVISTHCYTMYSWNSTVNHYSGGVQQSWGGLTINV